jgi:hypothetical protein
MLRKVVHCQLSTAVSSQLCGITRAFADTETVSNLFRNLSTQHHTTLAGTVTRLQHQLTPIRRSATLPLPFRVFTTGFLD